MLEKILIAFERNIVYLKISEKWIQNCIHILNLYYAHDSMLEDAQFPTVWQRICGKTNLLYEDVYEDNEDGVFAKE